jgi:fatty acid desaturase
LYAGILRATVADTNATVPDYLTITVNQTMRPNWSVTSIGTDTTGPIITLSGLSNALAYLITITYQFSVTAASLALLNLIPLIWVVVVLSVGVAAIYIQFRNMRS